jgi:5'-3' exonuclease
MKKFMEAVDITPEMANVVIHSLKSLNIECIIAPYEADA